MIQRIGAGHFHVAAVVDGDVYTWGYGEWGALGLGHKAQKF
jgi:alpha-tubulin suppressor-like RCC1 family protein